MTISVTTVVVTTVGIAEDGGGKDGLADDEVAEDTTGTVVLTLVVAEADVAGGTDTEICGGIGPVVVFTTVHGHLVIVMLVASVTVYVISLTLNVVGDCIQVSVVVLSSLDLFTYRTPSGKVVSGQHSCICVDSRNGVVSPTLILIFGSIDSGKEPESSKKRLEGFHLDSGRPE